MTDRLADVGARIEGVRQLGAVVNAMRGIAAARARQARTELGAVDSYAATISRAIGQARDMIGGRAEAPAPPSARAAVVVFLAEQGFAGAFSERVLDHMGASVGTAEIFLVGTRGASVAAERGLTAKGMFAMPARSSGIPALANRIADSLYARIATGSLARLEVVFGDREAGGETVIQRRALFPLDTQLFPKSTGTCCPITYLPHATLLEELAADFVHAQLCEAALHAFAAENEARMEAMSAASSQIERQLSALQATQRIVRQEEITAEIIELAAGQEASA